MLYIDGHVRVYHGTGKNLPKHYVARRAMGEEVLDKWVECSICRYPLIRQLEDCGGEFG